MMHLINFGYKGKIYPINLKSPEVMGIKAYPTLDSIPDTVEHVIYCIGLENMPAFLDSCAKKRGEIDSRFLGPRGRNRTGRRQRIGSQHPDQKPGNMAFVCWVPIVWESTAPNPALASVLTSPKKRAMWAPLFKAAAALPISPATAQCAG